ncbi:YcjX family protein (plasmid) [Klebsiella pneumoniae]|uniref:DNA replication protein n=1 Tax=Klebsiella pneumoniae TaxID=573 RepID=A0A6M4NXV4_KLEPN|nr:hypothetical protein [Klebsiella pneumoniae]AWA71496.1 YcjX family protein [Klebsiella pneumoniae]QJS02098.1 hypothetical protein [Klebsiella pneumoniae]
MGSCAAPSAKGDDKFITTDYLQQCRHDGATTSPPPGDLTGEGSPEVRGEDEHTRHGGTTWRHLSAGGFIAGMVKAA